MHKPDNFRSPMEIVISAIDLKTILKVFPEGVIFLDLETTGLSPILDKIIEVAAIKLTPQGKVEVFDQLVWPEIQIPDYSTNIHQITNEMVANLPPIQSVLPSFLNFVGNYPLVAQNAKFDIGFLVFTMHKGGFRLPPCRVFDSSRFARKALPDLKYYSLSFLTQHLNVPLQNHHRALEDTLACLKMVAQVLQLTLKDESLNINQIRSQGLLFQMDEFRNLSSLEVPTHLQNLIPRLVKQEILEIEYRGGSHKDKFRPVRLVSFMPLPQGTVLYAFCFLSNIYKSFSLRKIKSFRFLSLDDQEKWKKSYLETTGYTP